MKSISNHWLAILFGFLIATPALSGPGYIKIGDIKGESEAADNADHKDWIVIESMSWPTAATASEHGEFWFEDLRPGAHSETPDTGNRARLRADPRNENVGTASGQATGKHQHKPLTVTKEKDKATPVMMHRNLAPETAMLVVEGRFETCEPGTRYPLLGVQHDGAAYQLHDVTVEGCAQSLSTSGDADDRPTEEVAFYYNKIAFSYARKDMVMKGKKILEN